MYPVLHDGGLDTTEKKRGWWTGTTKKPDEAGHTLLHYCKFCNGVVLYASENDPALADRGFYDHGKYPFVFDTLFVEEDSPAGFGYIDVMKDTQTAIDEMNAAMDENVKLSAKARYIIQDGAGINEKELADFGKDIVHAAGRVTDETLRPLQTAGLAGNLITYRDARVAELKEISGNRDVSQGGTTSGLTAASAIAALQEAGSKLSRDMLKALTGPCKGMLFYHRPDAAVLRREPGLPHYRRQRPAGVCAVLRGNAAAPAGWHDRRGGAGKPRTGV